jgi:hypothetical protein
MEPITIGFIVAVSGIAAAYKVIHTKNEQKEWEKEKEDMFVFLQELLRHDVIFRKKNRLGVRSNQYIASKEVFELTVSVTSNELSFSLYSLRKGKKRTYLSYSYNRSLKKGQIVQKNNEFYEAHEPLMNDLIHEMIHYNWENPMMYYAKETVKFFTEPTQKKEEIKENPLEKVDKLYKTLKGEGSQYFSQEDMHVIERLYHRDLKNLREIFDKMNSKGEKEKEMKDSLQLIYEKLKKYEDKLEEFRKHEFQKQVEIVKKRKS